MSRALETRGQASLHVHANRIVGWLSSFALAAMAALAVTINVVIESFHAARLGAALVFLFLLHLLRYPKFPFGRETALYVCFVIYMVVALAWTSDVRLAMNTLVPAITFVATLMLFGALATYHNLRAMLLGTLFGILMGAAAYTRIEGFPFVYPKDFSYNAVAGIYLLGLFVTFLCSCYWRSRGLFLFVASVLFILEVATTSIKFNIGILLGVIAAGLMYFKHFARTLQRHVVPLTVLVGVLGYAVVSNDALVGILERGIDRVTLGVEVLQARENVPGYSAFESRERWQSDGLKGWLQNPLFGNGVEAFRDRFGITSHSTPVDLLYNFGLIGFTLFYAVFLSVFRRSLRAHDRTWDGLHALIFGASICYSFVSLSAPMHYNAFFAVFVAISATVLGRHAYAKEDATDSAADE